jgi:hypothetical protein
MLTSSSNPPCIEQLEDRTLLAALAVYYPLVARAWWLDQNPRGSASEKEFIARKMTHFDGQRVFQRISTPPGEQKTIEYESYGPDGGVLLHGFKEGSLTFNFDPPVTLPLQTTPGTRSISTGTVIMSEPRISMEGPYRVAFTVLQPARVRVPAGTFSTVKIRMNLSMTATFDQQGVKARMKITGTETQWLAKRVGAVKTVHQLNGLTEINGEQKTTESGSTTVLKDYFIPRK